MLCNQQQQQRERVPDASLAQSKKGLKQNDRNLLVRKAFHLLFQNWFFTGVLVGRHRSPTQHKLFDHQEGGMLCISQLYVNPHLTHAKLPHFSHSPQGMSDSLSLNLCGTTRQDNVKTSSQGNIIKYQVTSKQVHQPLSPRKYSQRLLFLVDQHSISVKGTRPTSFASLIRHWVKADSALRSIVSPLLLLLPPHI